MLRKMRPKKPYTFIVLCNHSGEITSKRVTSNDVQFKNVGSEKLEPSKITT